MVTDPLPNPAEPFATILTGPPCRAARGEVPAFQTVRWRNTPANIQPGIRSSSGNVGEEEDGESDGNEIITIAIFGECHG